VQGSIGALALLPKNLKEESAAFIAKKRSGHFAPRPLFGVSGILLIADFRLQIDHLRSLVKSENGNLQSAI